MTYPAESGVAPWPAPAKLNLFLHIVGRRSDGMHELQTVFQFIDWCDQLWFSVREDSQIVHLNPLPGVSAATDLCVRAAALLQQYSGSRAGVDIQIDKQLPLGGGIGGGSSDAATTLVALNQLWQLHLDTGTLAGLGLQLGADVPVFVRGQAAWAEGVGERLTPVAPVESWFLVIKPDCEVPTGQIFSAADLTRSTPPMTIRDFLAADNQRLPGHNDCEPVARRLFPPVAAALDWLNRFGTARMTGTGACVFARFDNEAEALAVAEKYPAASRIRCVRGLNTSPLLQRLAMEDKL